MSRNGTGSRTGPYALAAKARQVRALELRRNGASFDQIARDLGYGDRTGAHKAVLTALRDTLTEPAEAVRTLELARLDAMLEGIWPAAIAGDVQAIHTVLKIQDRRARYLGLDQPIRIDVEAHIRAVAIEQGLDPDEAVMEAVRILKSGRD